MGLCFEVRREMKGWALGERSVEREVEMMTALHLAWGVCFSPEK